MKQEGIDSQSQGIKGEKEKGIMILFLTRKEKREYQEKERQTVKSNIINSLDELKILDLREVSGIIGELLSG